MQEKKSIATVPNRSAELQAWIEDCGTREEVKKRLRDLPMHLRKELCDEARQDPRVRHALDRWLNKALKDFPSASNDLRIIEEYCKYDSILGSVKFELAGWNCGNAPTSNVISNSALFHVQVPKTARKVYHKQILASRANVTIRYSGEELYQDDLDVLLCLINISKDAIGARHTVTWATLLRMLGLQETGRSYEKVQNSLERLCEGSISVRRTYSDTPPVNQKGKQLRDGILNSDWGVRHLLMYVQCERGKPIVFALDISLTQYFSNNEYGLVDTKKRFSLGKNDLAKMLQCIIAGQAANIQRYKVSTLQRYSGLECEERFFKRYLVIAMQKLVVAGIIFDFEIPKVKRGSASEQILVIHKKDPNQTLFVAPV